MTSTDYSEEKILKHALGITAWTFVATRTVGLYVVAPTDAAGGTEVAGGSYARQTATWAWDAGNGWAYNSAAITFTMPTTDVRAWAVFDDTNTMIFYKAFASSTSYLVGQQARFPAAHLKIRQS